MEALTKNSAHSQRGGHCQSARQSCRRKEGGAGRRANDVADRVMTFPCRLPACLCLSLSPCLCLIRVSCWKRKCLLFNCFVLSCFAWLQLFEELVARQEAISCKCYQRYCNCHSLKEVLQKLKTEICQVNDKRIFSFATYSECFDTHTKCTRISIFLFYFFFCGGRELRLQLICWLGRIFLRLSEWQHLCRKKKRKWNCNPEMHISNILQREGGRGGG